MDEFIRKIPIDITLPQPNLIRLPPLNITTEIEPIPYAVGSTTLHELRMCTESPPDSLGNDPSIKTLTGTLQEYELPSLDEDASMLFTRNLNKEKNV